MPLASFAFTGCDAGHVPLSGSTHAGGVALGGSADRGWGGNGGGSQPVPGLWRFASMARHTANAAPASSPTPKARHTALRRIATDCRTTSRN